MIAMQVARLIADFCVFFELADEEILNPDAAVDMMEDLSARMEGFDNGFIRELLDAFEIIAAENSGEVAEVIRNIGLAYQLEDKLAGNDPVRLAELDALRDAQT